VWNRYAIILPSHSAHRNQVISHPEGDYLYILLLPLIINMGARAPLLSRRIQFHSCKLVPFFPTRTSLCVCVWTLYNRPCGGIQALSGSPRPTHTHTQKCEEEEDE
jgi:hypothetical protein